MEHREKILRHYVKENWETVCKWLNELEMADIETIHSVITSKDAAAFMDAAPHVREGVTKLAYLSFQECALRNLDAQRIRENQEKTTPSLN